MIVPQLNLRFNLLGAVLIVAFGFLFVTGLVASDRRGRFIFVSDLRHDRRHRSC